MTVVRGVGRRSLLGLLGIGCIAPSAFAQDGGPRGVIQAFCQQLEKIMRAGSGTPFKARFDMLAPAVDRAFDLATILSVSVGPRWQTVDPAARATLADVFRVYTIVSYVANFNKYGGERFDVTEATRAVGADQVVSTRIVPTSGDGVKLDYLMRQSDGGWRVVDVLADGTISRVAVQRSDFRALLGRDMNTVALLDSLRRKIADLSGGAVA